MTFRDVRFHMDRFISFVEKVLKSWSKNARDLRDRLMVRATKLKKDITALAYVYQDPKAPVFSKILIGITLAYALSPIDLIPDFIPVIGYLDDLIIVPALIALSLKLIPKDVMETARERAEKEPLSLRKNWFVALLMVLFWILLITWVIVRIVVHP